MYSFIIRSNTKHYLVMREVLEPLDAKRLLEYILYPKAALNREKLRRALEGKTILITGASSGIGEQLAYILAECSVHLVLVARREERLLAVKAEVERKSAKASVYAADLRNPQEIEGLLHVLHQLPQGIDIVVSNAGHSIRRPIFASLDRLHDVTRTMAINYVAPVQLLLSLLPVLERKQGHIISISTINALLHPLPYWAAYQASKTAFDIWLRSAAPELHARRILTTSVYLPLVRTPMILPTRAYSKAPAMSAAQAAAVICRAMVRKNNMYKPWWTVWLQLASVCFRGVMEAAASNLLARKEKAYAMDQADRSSS